MDHSHMDHGHMGHGGMDSSEPMCNMNMVFTWDYNNLCIIFKSWRITSITSLLFSLLAVIVLTAGYEVVREASRRYNERTAKTIESMPSKCLSALQVIESNIVLEVYFQIRPSSSSCYIKLAS